MIVLEDISCGKEMHKIPVENVFTRDVPQLAEYVCTSLPNAYIDTEESEYTGCDCQAPTRCTEDSCECVRDRSYGCTFDGKGRLNVSDLLSKPIFECNRHCSCLHQPQRCTNRVVQFGIQRRLCVFRSIACGWSLKTLEDISKGTFVCEYAGEVLDYIQAKSRALSHTLSSDYYLYVLREHVSNGKLITTYVDPTEVGNVGRFANHCCDPNMVMVPVRIDCSVPRLSLFASRDISFGEELRFDYSSGESTETVSVSGATKPCLCNAWNCRGRLPYDNSLFAV